MAPLQYAPPPERCELLADMAKRCGGQVTSLSPAETADYPLPALATEEVRDFWRTETRAEIAPVQIARLPGGRVFGHGIVLSPDGKIIARDVSLDFGKPFDAHWLLGSEKLRSPRFVAGSTAVIATNLGAGYAHWLLEELPRLLMLPRGAAEGLIAHDTPPFSRCALAQCGWTVTVLSVGRTTHYECAQLVVPGLVGTVGHPSRRALDVVAEFASGLRTEDASFGERLYISREYARRRKVANEFELWAELAAAGFSKVCLEALSWPEQIAAFRRAKIVVAPHGAGLANVAFCRPGTVVVELFNRSYVHGCFWRLSALQGLDYRPVVSAGAEPLSQASGCNALDIVVDLPLVRSALRHG